MSPEAVVSQADLGRRIADARAEAGMTQADLAADIGVERTALVRVESGERKVSATELVAIAGALGRPVDWFFTESPPAVVAGAVIRRWEGSPGPWIVPWKTPRGTWPSWNPGVCCRQRSARRARRRRASSTPRTLPAASAWKQGGRTARCQTFSRSRRAWGCLGFPSPLAPMLVTPPMSLWGTLASRSSTGRPIRAAEVQPRPRARPPPGRRRLRAVPQARAV